MNAGDIVRVDFGIPVGSEAGFVRPAIVITADRVLMAAPRTVHVVPMTSNIERRLPTEVEISAAAGGVASMAQCHLSGAVSVLTFVDGGEVVGRATRIELAQIRSVMADLLDLY